MGFRVYISMISYGTGTTVLNLVMVGRWPVSSWLLGTIAGWFIFVGGLVSLWYFSWKVKGALVYRVYQHCRNFAAGAALAFGILVCIIGFMWDIMVI